jgi:predicted GNAT superfamily acetyltransferase
VEYLVDFYGAMPDAINNNDQSDRILVSWDLTSARVEKAARGAARESNLDEWIEAGATVALDVGAQDQPVPQAWRGDIVLCPTPGDIISLRNTNPDVAREWRHMVREVMLSGVARGLRITAMTRSGWYVMERR